MDEKQYLVGETARKTYDSLNKRGAFYINWFEDDHAKDITWDLNTADALDNFVEVYVIGKNYECTYIKTHEYGLGPYLLLKNKDITKSI